jgi:hypothetical protein
MLGASTSLSLCPRDTCHTVFIVGRGEMLHKGPCPQGDFAWRGVGRRRTRRRKLRLLAVDLGVQVDHAGSPVQPAGALPRGHPGRGSGLHYTLDLAAPRARLGLRGHQVRPSPGVPGTLFVSVVAVFADLQNMHRQPIWKPRRVPCGASATTGGFGTAPLTRATPRAHRTTTSPLHLPP